MPNSERQRFSAEKTGELRPLSPRHEGVLGTFFMYAQNRNYPLPGQDEAFRLTRPQQQAATALAERLYQQFEGREYKFVDTYFTHRDATLRRVKTILTSNKRNELLQDTAKETKELFHHGDTDVLETVVTHALSETDEEILNQERSFIQQIGEHLVTPIKMSSLEKLFPEPKTDVAITPKESTETEEKMTRILVNEEKKLLKFDDGSLAEFGDTTLDQVLWDTFRYLAENHDKQPTIGQLYRRAKKIAPSEYIPGQTIIEELRTFIEEDPSDPNILLEFIDGYDKRYTLDADIVLLPENSPTPEELAAAKRWIIGRDRQNVLIRIDKGRDMYFRLTEKLANVCHIPEDHEPQENIKDLRKTAETKLTTIYEQYATDPSYQHPDDDVHQLITAMQDMDKNVMGGYLLKFLSAPLTATLETDRYQAPRTAITWRAPYGMEENIRKREAEIAEDQDSTS